MNGEELPYPQTISDILAMFMQRIEEWQTTIEGSPTDVDMRELTDIYDVSELEIRTFIKGEKSL